jgi:MFS family permease
MRAAGSAASSVESLVTSPTPAADAATPPTPDEPRPFHGRRAIGAAFTAQLLGNAVTFAAFGVFLVPLSEEFGIPRGRLGLGFSVAFLVMGGLGPLVGRWLDRGLTRTLMITGCALAGLGAMALSRASAPWQLALSYCGLIAVGTALFSMAPSQALVANWFIRRRGMALGFAVAGATVAAMVAPPLAAFLIDGQGWRGAALWFGAGTLAIGLPIFAFLVVARPEAVGQTPDGDPPAADSPHLPGGISVPTPPETRELVRDPRLWLLAAGFGLVFTSPIVMVNALVPFAEDRGISRQTAAYFFTAAGPFSLLGKLAFGAMADRVAPKLAIWLVAAGNAVVWSMLFTGPGETGLLAIGALYGLAIGAVGPLNGVVVGLCFGRLAFGRASGLGGLAGLPLIAGAPALAGYLYDTTGTYQAVFLTQVGFMLLGGVLLSLVRIPRVAT